MSRNRIWIVASAALALSGALVAAASTDSASGYVWGVLVAWLGLVALLVRPEALKAPDAAVRNVAWMLIGGIFAVTLAWIIAPAFRGALFARLGLGLMILGGVAVWLGFARRVGDEPVCAACGYSVDTAEPPRKCAECGRDLWPRGAIARGRRERHPHLMGAGVLAALLGAGAAIPTFSLGAFSLVPTPALVAMGSAHTLDASGLAELATRKITTADADAIASAILGPAGDRVPTVAEADWIIAAVSNLQLVGPGADRAMLAAIRPRLRVATVTPHDPKTSIAVVLFECDAISERARDVFVAIGSPPNAWGGPRGSAVVCMTKRIATGLDQEGQSLTYPPDAASASVPVRLFILPPKGAVPTVGACDAVGAPLPFGTEVWGLSLDLKASLAPVLPGRR